MMEGLPPVFRQALITKLQVLAQAGSLASTIAPAVEATKQELRELLLRRFGGSDLKRLLSYLPSHGRRISDSLPGETASAMQVTDAAVDYLIENDVVLEDAFWEMIERKRPRCVDEIRRVRALFCS